MKAYLTKDEAQRALTSALASGRMVAGEVVLAFNGGHAEYRVHGMKGSIRFRL